MSTKFYFLLVSLGLLACGCRGDKPSNDPVISQRYIHKYGYAVSKTEWETKKYPGQVITTLRNGVTVTANYENGELHGSSTNTYPHSQTIQAYYVYNQGKVVKETLYDIKGMPLSERLQLSPTRYSLTLWYTDGTPLSIEEYAGDEILEAQYFTTTNEIESRIEKGTGLRTRRDREGSLLSKDKIEAGYLVKRESFYPNGQPDSIAYYRMNQLYGEQKNFAEDGEPLSISEWIDGKLNGKCTYFKNGAKFLEVSYLNNEKNGMETHFTPEGHISQETLWEDNKKHGLSVYHIEGGDHSEWYYGGKVVSKDTFDKLNNIDSMISEMAEDIQIYE